MTPFCRFSGSLRASTTKTSPTLPWVMNIFAPLSTQPLSLRTAVERIPAASEPLPGSVRAHAAELSSRRDLGDEPLAQLVAAEAEQVRGAEAIVRGDRQRERAVPARDLLDHARRRQSVSSSDAAQLLGDRHPQKAQLAELRRPSRAGTRSSRSHSCACGLTSRTQKSRTIATSFRWLSFSSKSNRLSVPRAPGFYQRTVTCAPPARRQPTAPECRHRRPGGKSRRPACASHPTARAAAQRGGR